MSIERTEEAQVLETIVPSLEAQGYSVYLNPAKSLLPPTLQNIIPDAVALGRPRNLVIEIVQEGSQRTRRLNQVREQLSQSPNWELRVYYIRPAVPDRALQTVSVSTIDASLTSMEELASSDRLQPALIMGWAILEAAGRALLPGKFGRPQPPANLVEVLAGEGHLTPSEADDLRKLAELRNQFIHGGLAVTIDLEDIQRFLLILKTLVAQLPAHAA